MKSIMKYSIPIVTLLFLVGIVAYSFSQQVGYGYIDRARAVSGQPNPNQPPPGISPQDFAQFQRGNQVLSGQQPQNNQPAPPPEIKMIPVVEGELVISAKSGEILQKPEKKMVPETLKDNYYDDGTHGDEVANDGIYSNVVVRKDVISKDEFKQRLMLESLINRISKDNPVEFYRLYVAADGHDPEIPSYSYWKSRRDEFVNDYKARVLAPYKDANGNFYEVYEPPKPATPAVANTGQMPGQPYGQPQNVGVASSVQGRVNQAQQDQANMGIGASSYFGEQNRMR